MAQVMAWQNDNYNDRNSYWRSVDAGFPSAASPILLSVPHSGRRYPEALLANLRIPAQALHKLEDRYADLLISAALKQGHEALVAIAPRAWIDINRHPDDLDRKVIKGIAASAALDRVRARTGADSAVNPSPRRAGVGLGLVPTRLNAYGDIWRNGWTIADIRQRIACVHAPYHDAITQRLDLRLNHYGCAILLDVHSMPSLSAEPSKAQTPAQILFGDRYGVSAPDDLVMQLEAISRDHGFRAGRNRPYAGGYVLDRHSRTNAPVYAIQIEVDRALYLDSEGVPGRAIDAVRTLIAELADAAASYARAIARPQAAE